MYVNGEEVFLPRIRTRHVSQSIHEAPVAASIGTIKGQAESGTWMGSLD
ncbi:MAG: hypothetical protein AVDCRST_MAG93-6813 [uncultured Chloroflexia bacterium]|uniref:Uncharacterized protein n=1 Tax=uncultured Chloroflexia bacterium TaxID=1672391 RepID=A0A6J4LZQ4_9CHLR|nr:MAG: hypothetical protein AVDCRST_MAG93-6813 [uncultured Chloroflexia bacterium]